MLLTTTQKLQVLLAGAATTQLPIIAGWADVAADASTLAPGASTTTTNDTIAVDVVAAPAAGLRQLKYLSVHNADAATATVTLRVDDGGTLRTIATVALFAGYRLEYLPDCGLRVLSQNGALMGLGDPGTDGVGVPAGGTVGQVLAKVSATNYDTGWVDQSGGGAGIEWLTVDATGTSVVRTHERIAAAGLTRTLPSTIAANDFFVFKAYAGDVIVSTPHTIKYGGVIKCNPGDTLTVAHGETLYLLAGSTTELEIA
jgi:hypothetical protein